MLWPSCGRSYNKRMDKTCTICGTSKALDAFPKLAASPDGHAPRCKSCRSEREASQEYRDARNARRRERYREADEFREAEKKRKRAAKLKVTPEMRKRYRVKSKQKFAEHDRARNAVRRRVKFGRMPRASSLPCALCAAPAVEYHHHLGYSRAHRYSVIALCLDCHKKAHRKDSTRAAS